MSVTKTLPIDKGVPLPAKCATRITVGYDFGAMEVGDSFFRPLDDAAPANLQRSILAASVHFKAKSPELNAALQFTTRQVTENGISGIRCWRTA
jgi:hypothetical protein